MGPSRRRTLPGGRCVLPTELCGSMQPVETLLLILILLKSQFMNQERRVFIVRFANGRSSITGVTRATNCSYSESPTGGPACSYAMPRR